MNLRELFKRHMPQRHVLHSHRALRPFGALLHDPNLWHLNRRSAAGAVAVGLFMAWVPVPFQMVLAAAAAILLRVNLPISVLGVWVTNPLTMPPFFFLAYKVGAWVLGVPAQKIHFELSLSWIEHRLVDIWDPFLLGCAIMAILSASVGFVTVRLLWRLHLVRIWKEKQRRRRLRAGGGSASRNP
jgi:uncharacterized protein